MLKFGKDVLTITSVSEIYPTAVICLFWALDSFWVARMFWLPYHNSNKLRTLATPCNCLSSASLVSSVSFSASVGSNTGLSPAIIPWLDCAYFLTSTLLRSVSPVGSNWLHPILFCQRGNLPFTLTRCGIIENMSRATLDRSAYIECDSSCWCHQWVIWGNHNVLLISIGWEW